MAANPEAFDFIIVGAGSAGCVLADRLTADGRNTVLVLEFGGSDRSLLIRMPAALSAPMNTARYNWHYQTEPEPHLGGRRLHCPRGKVVGGSSSINGLVYVRGHPLDFERWEEEGAAGWGYRHVLPYFRRAEARQEGGNAWRGASGPLATRYGRLANPLYRAFVEAAQQAGYGGEAALPTRADPALLKALARAFRYQRMLDEGRYASISEMAAAEKIERGYLGSLLRLTLIAPDIVEAILDGRQP